jgi:Mn-containing catalase
VPMVIAEERFEEYAPGLDKNLLALIQAAAEIEMAPVTNSYGPLA